MWRAATIGLALGLGGVAVEAQAGDTRVFTCSLGRKAVSVTAEGGAFVYRFGRPGVPELMIAGSARRGNLSYRTARYSGMEYQLRFARGRYSYVVYSLEGNGQTGARPASGLVVMDGLRRVADMPCRTHAEFATGFPFGELPEDGEEYTAM